MCRFHQTATGRCWPTFANFLGLDRVLHFSPRWKNPHTTQTLLWKNSQRNQEEEWLFFFGYVEVKTKGWFLMDPEIFIASLWQSQTHNLQFSLNQTYASPAAQVRSNICIANCSHSLSTLKKGRLWAQAFSPITAVVSLIPQLHAMWKFHSPTGLIPTTQYPYSNLIPKGAFDLRANCTRSFWNVLLVSFWGLSRYTVTK